MRKLILLTFLMIGFTQAQVAHKAEAVDPVFRPFYHGVASGDPLSDKVIIWTRVTPDNSTQNQISVDWMFSLDTTFTNIVTQGTYVTDSTKDYTVKVDVAGLQPNTYYFYKFRSNNLNSVIGRTKTIPTGNIDSLRLAIVSCASWEHGWFNAYERLKNRNDIDAVLHLGDYIYEYNTGGFASNNVTQQGRTVEPTNEIISQKDYLIRHSHYKLDKNLRELHQQYPFITVWDDHETANDSYKDGADNHTEGTEGLWQERKKFGITAYQLWMPIRLQNVTDSSQIWRNFQFGNLFNLYMLDTRLHDRDKQEVATGSAYQDTNRRLIGQTQMSWLVDGMKSNTSKWNIIGQQVMFAPLKFLGQPLNMDQWDGYPAERKRLMDAWMTNNIKNVVVLTGDIHTSWANDIPYSSYNSSTGAGSAGVEFVATSVTSTGASFLGPLGAGGSGAIKLANPHMKYIELTKHGYIILDINQTRLQGDYYFVNSVETKGDTVENWEQGWYTNENERFLRNATSKSIRTTPGFMQAPVLPNNPVSIDKQQNVVWLSTFPNPFHNQFYTQFSLKNESEVTFKITDMVGRTVFVSNAVKMPSGINYIEMKPTDLKSGNYIFTIETPNGKISKTMTKD